MLGRKSLTVRFPQKYSKHFLGVHLISVVQVVGLLRENAEFYEFGAKSPAPGYKVDLQLPPSPSVSTVSRLDYPMA